MPLHSLPLNKSGLLIKYQYASVMAFPLTSPLVSMNLQTRMEETESNIHLHDSQLSPWRWCVCVCMHTQSYGICNQVKERTGYFRSPGYNFSCSSKIPMLFLDLFPISLICAKKCSALYFHEGCDYPSPGGFGINTEFFCRLEAIEH